MASFKIYKYLSLTLQEWVLRSFKLLSKEESIEAFNEISKSNNKFVTWEEYKANGQAHLGVEDLSHEKLMFFVSKLYFFLSHLQIAYILNLFYKVK